MKVKSFITDDGKTYKEVKDNTSNGTCSFCLFNEVNCDGIPCPDFGYKWEEVPEITNEIQQDSNEIKQAYIKELKKVITKIVNDTINKTT